MLYKLSRTSDGPGNLEPVAFLDLPDLQKREKDLENLLAEHLLDILFEVAALLPIFQQRSLQTEADVYAVNELGDLVVFDLKRGLADEESIHQAIRSAQDAGRWSFSEIERRYLAYTAEKGLPATPLKDAHQEAFQIEKPLQPSQFNRRQHLYVVGSAANDGLIAAVEWWKRQGLSVDFIPYRIYAISGQSYFEFFSLPYDRHRNPTAVNGVLFDTSRRWDEDAIWTMIEKRRVAAYHDAKHVVRYLNTKDIVFFYHKAIDAEARSESPRIKLLHQQGKHCRVSLGVTDPDRTQHLFVSRNPGQDLVQLDPQTILDSVEEGYDMARYVACSFPHARNIKKLIRAFSNKKNLAFEEVVNSFGVTNLSFFHSSNTEALGESFGIEVLESIEIVLEEMAALPLVTLLLSGVSHELFALTLYRKGAPVEDPFSIPGSRSWMYGFRTTIRTGQVVKCVFLTHLSATRGLSNDHLTTLGENLSQIV